MAEETSMATVTDPYPSVFMPMLVTDPQASAEIIEDRRARGIDHHDEVWEGLYVMSPAANNEHQQLVLRLALALVEAVDRANLGRSYPGVNVTDRADDWTKNYRCPDVVTFLTGNAAVDRQTHWLGGPDLAIEIVSPYDRSREKIEFYAKIGTRELLLVDRAPWQLELFRLCDGNLNSVGIATVENGIAVACETAPLSFALRAAEIRPEIEIAHLRDVRRWKA